MGQYRYSAVATLESATHDPGRGFESGTNNLMVHACRAEPPGGKYFAAVITWEAASSWLPGETRRVTIQLSDSEALSYFCTGSLFDLWGGGTGYGTICRRVFTDYRPS